MAFVRLARSTLLIAGLLAHVTATLANYCPRFPCPSERVDTLDRLTSLKPIKTTPNFSNDVAACKASCPCPATYYVLYQTGNPLTYTCYCYKECKNGTFTGPPGRGSPSIRQGYICGTACHDPHFVGAHGTHYDFNGALDKAFCLVTDRHLHLNALFKGYTADSTAGATVLADGKGLRTWMGELGLVWLDAQGWRHDLRLAARSGPEVARGTGFLQAAALDGAAVAIPQGPGEVLRAADLALTFTGTEATSWGGQQDTFILSVGNRLELSLQVAPALPAFQLPEDALVHFSFSVRSLSPSPAIHGVLGQTYRRSASQLLKAVKYSALSHMLREPVKADGVSGMGFLDGKVTDYATSDLLSTDCAVSAFAA